MCPSARVAGLAWKRALISVSVLVTSSTEGASLCRRADALFLSQQERKFLLSPFAELTIMWRWCACGRSLLNWKTRRSAAPAGICKCFLTIFFFFLRTRLAFVCITAQLWSDLRRFESEHQKRREKGFAVSGCERAVAVEAMETSLGFTCGLMSAVYGLSRIKKCSLDSRRE